jgi:hypothetical protein
LIGKFKSLFLCATACLLSGCSGSNDHEHPAKLLYEGTARKVEYDLTEGKTTVIDDKGKSHAIEGYPMMFKGKIKLTTGDHGYDIVILSLAEPAAPAAEGTTNAPASTPAAIGNEYE